jgi:hypothetical protein
MSHGSEQSEDYWPGYVDALTSMVQVLAFVMMLLAVTVYVLSKNISKGAVEKIAKAANVSPAPNTSVKELTEKIVEELTKAQQQKTEGGAAKAAESAAASQAKSAEKQAEGKDPTTINTAQKSRASSATQSDQQAEPPPDAKHISVRFPERSYKIDQASIDAMAKFTEENALAGEGMRVIIRAYASNASGAVTEGRHMAYYRAMVARQLLSGRKVPPKSISIRILDTADPELGSSIEIYAVREGAQ